MPFASMTLRHARMRRTARAGGVAIAIAGLLVLAGWAVENAFLKSLVPGLVPMNPVTALSFFLAGVALRLLVTEAPKETANAQAWRWLALGCSVIVALGGLLRVVGVFTPWDLGVDQLLFSTKLSQAVGELPNRMAPNTALCFFLSGIGLALLANKSERGALSAQLLALSAGSVALLALIGYVYSVLSLYSVGVGPHTPMALNTALAFATLSLGTLLARPDHGLMRVVASERAGGALARTLFPATLLIPVITGMLALLGEHEGLYDNRLRLAICVVASAYALIAMVWLTARHLDLVDVERGRAEEELQRSSELLEVRVQERTAELARAKAQLEHKNEELSLLSQQLWQTAKLATMGELAASIAHELNNPLGTVTLRVEGLLEDLPPESSHRRDLEVIDEELERMANLVANLLQFSRRSQQQVSTLNVREEIDATLELLHFHLAKRRIVVVREYATELPKVQADRQQLRQVLVNLLTNASDAMPNGGTLTLRARSNGRVVIEIEDTGCGIPSSLIDKVKEPFFTTKGEGKGTGLGLAISQRIIQEHQGSFSLESREGQGTTVRIDLPNCK